LLTTTMPSSNTSKRLLLEEKDDKTTDMADLAPFVAAVLRDRTVEDLVQENQRLRRENQRFRDRFKVTIVDQNNGTTLEEADDLTENADESKPSDGEWVVDLYQVADFEFIGPLQIKVGNRTVETINPADIRDNTLSAVGVPDRPSPCVSSCWVTVHPSREEKELPEAFWDIMDQELGLIEMLRRLKNFDPGLSVEIDRISIRIRAEQLLMRDF